MEARSEVSRLTKMMKPLPSHVILHVPHDSTVIPASVRTQLLLDDGELATELGKITDHQTLDLFAIDVPLHQIVRSNGWSCERGNAADKTDR